MKLLVLGGSYTGKYIHTNFPEHIVFFLSRNPGELMSSGFRPFQIEMLDSEKPFDMILDTVPALHADSTDVIPPYFNEVKQALEFFPGLPYVHISSTSVYPQGKKSDDHHALPVFDETTEAEPSNEQGQRRLLLEKSIRLHYPSSIIIRSGGIYGPGRGIAIKIQSKTFTGSNENRMISRIHVHDLARLCIAVSGYNYKMINGVDSNPSSNSETFTWLENLTEEKIPGTWRDMPVSGRIIKSLYAEKILGHFKFPSYRDGISDIAEKNYYRQYQGE